MFVIQRWAQRRQLAAAQLNHFSEYKPWRQLA
jgi:hypothetical protein